MTIKELGIDVTDREIARACALGNMDSVGAMKDKIAGRPIESCYRGEIIASMHAALAIELPLLDGLWLVYRVVDRGGTVLVWAQRDDV